MKIQELNHAQVLHLLPDRPADAHKGDFGKMLLLCGSKGYTGAAAIAAMGALRSGAGLVYLGVPESIYAIESVKLTEPVVFPLPDEGGMYSTAGCQQVKQLLQKMDAVLIGPGIGQSEGTLSMLQTVLSHASCPVVLDADGINLLAAHRDVLRGRTCPLILKPHDGEFSRISCLVGQDRVSSAAALARELDAIVLLKGHRTLITDGIVCYRNTTGNPGMAVGGSGDLLAGILTGLLGQGLQPLLAAACAAWLHGAAGDLCADDLGQYAMLPSDMLGYLPRLLK